MKTDFLCRKVRLAFCKQIKHFFSYKLIVSIWLCVGRYAQSTENSNFAILRIKLNFCQKIAISLNWYYHFRCVYVWPGMPKLPKTTSLLCLCDILKKKWVMKLIFCIHIRITFPINWHFNFWWGQATIPKVSKIATLQCLYNVTKNKLEMKSIFLQTDKHWSSLLIWFQQFGPQSFLQDDLIIIVGYDQAFSKYSN